MSRLVRWLAGRNALRRPVDRIEGAVLVALSAAFLVAVAVAAILGAHTYQSQRAASAGLRPAVAVLIQAGPFYGSPAHLGQAEARWRGPGGGEQSGVLTTVTAPGIAGAAAGARIPVWLDRSGQPVAPPGGQVAMIVNALAVGAAAGRGCRDGVAHLLCAVPARARPAAAGRVGVCVVPDRAPMDNPSLTRTAPHRHHLDLAPCRSAFPATAIWAPYTVPIKPAPTTSIFMMSSHGAGYLRS